MPLRDALGQVRPYQPARPMSELQRSLGLARIVKLSSNEGAFGPLPAAVAAYEAAARELNRYPDGGGLRLREALAERHDVPVAQVVLGNGADELIRLCAVATLEQGDAAAFPWPSFPSYATAASAAAPTRSGCRWPGAPPTSARCWSGRAVRARGSCTWPTRTTPPAAR